MNNKEMRAEIRKKAYEYAKSGEHQSWLTIEHRIAAEGFSGAKNELDDQYIRKELISLCEKANSSEEVTRKNQFKIWLDDTVRNVAPILKKRKLDVYLTARNNILHIEGHSFSLQIRRRFYSNELEIKKEFEKDGKRYTWKVFDKIADTDFKRIMGDEAVEFILNLIPQIT